MILKKNILSILLLVFIANTSILFAQSFEDIRSKYESFEENNPRALPYIKQYISKAKIEKDYSHLSQGYLDESYYNSNVDVKLKYADSAIASANNSSNNELIVTAHMTKGTLIYFYFKKYRTALDEYLKAYNYSKKQMINIVSIPSYTI